MNIFIEPTRATPFVAYSPNENILHVRGRSSPKNPISFYRELLNFLDSFARSKQSTLIVNICMDYFNSSSTKCLFSVFKKMMRIQKHMGKRVVVNWFYSEWDQDMFETGTDFSECLGICFNLLPIDDNEKFMLVKSNRAA